MKFLRDNGVRVETDIIPPELHPGIDYAAYAFDPDGHCLELYYSMEQVGWDGKPRPQRVAPQSRPEQLAGHPRTAIGHLYRRTVHRPVGVREQRKSEVGDQWSFEAASDH